MCDGEDRCARIAVDGNDLLAFLHSRDVLDGTADAACDVKLGPDRHAGLTDLMIVIDPAGVNRRAGSSDFAAERFRKIMDQLEVFF